MKEVTDSPVGIWHLKKDKCVPDYAISSLAKLLGNIVTFINDKVLVEDLEDLATLEISHVVGAAISSLPWASIKARYTCA